jgi:hypothetical protein
MQWLVTGSTLRLEKGILSMSFRFRGPATGGVTMSLLMGITAAGDSRSSVAVKQLAANWNPEVKAAKIDQERLTPPPLRSSNLI